ncbi:MAG: hypothetical protein ACP5O8_02590 [Candidatus Aenigmatarchaeota archaeon]
MNAKEISKFRRIFSCLPEGERKLPIVKVDDRIFTWEEAYKEIIKKTSLGVKILKELKEMGLI